MFRVIFGTILCLAVASSAAAADHAAEDLNSFIDRCRAQQRPWDCWETIRTDLVRLRPTRQNRDYCMPRIWGAPSGELSSYPIGMIADVADRLAAARFGQSGQPYEVVLVRTLAQIFPCRR